MWMHQHHYINYPFVALIVDGIVLLLDNSVKLCFQISNVL